MKRADKILSLSIGIFVSLFLGEMSLRLFYLNRYTTKDLVLSKNNKLVYENKPSINFKNKYGIKVSYNSLGFIGNEIKSKQYGVFRILAIGDSITDATYLPQEERYVNRLGEILKKKANKGIEVINGGVGGYNTWQELELVKDKLLQVEPDLIMVGICLNDYIDTKPRLKDTAFNMVVENYRDGSRARYLDFLYQRSDLYKFLYDSLSTLRRMRYNDAGYRHYLEEYRFDINQADFKKWEIPFKEMITLAQRNNIKILFVLFPLDNQIVRGEKESCGSLSRFFKTEGAYYLDLIKDFNLAAADGKVLFVKHDIIHPTSLGHYITAEAIANYIIDCRILNKD